jgi:hypothetical protein
MYCLNLMADQFYDMYNPAECVIHELVCATDLFC